MLFKCFAKFCFLPLIFTVLIELRAYAEIESGPKRSTISFEDQLVEGGVTTPELFYLMQQRDSNFRRLIRLRENFLPEMRRSGVEIERRER